MLAAAGVYAALLAVGGSTAAAGSPDSCGKVSVFKVRVVKGGASCREARNVTSYFLDHTSGCGDPDTNDDCRVELWHCWSARARDQKQENMNGFCFMLKKPSAESNSAWKPRAYSAAFKIGETR